MTVAPPGEMTTPYPLPVPQLRILKPRPNEPRFDDETPDACDARVDGRSGPVVGALALRFSVDPHDDDQPRLRLVTDPGSGGAGALPRPARGWVARLVQAVAEALVGERPLPQLAPHVSPSVYAGLETAIGRTPPRAKRGPGVTPAVRSLRVCEPRPGAAEVAAVIRRGEGVGALALRLELHAGRWRCVALQVG